MNIILLGAPGSGKGTQAEILISKKGFVQFSTGDLMRKHISEQTTLGIECAKYINEGKLVPDEITNGIVKAYLKDHHDKLIFDGYPRTINQAQALNEMLDELGAKIDKVIYIDVAREILLERISGRIICPMCKRSYHVINRKPQVQGICDFDNTKLITRPDDAFEKVLVRLEEYQTNTAPLIDFYKDIEIVLHVNACEMTGEEVYAAVEASLN